MAHGEQAWRAQLQPYYREYGIDPAAIPVGPGRAPFTRAVADALQPFRPAAVVSFRFLAARCSRCSRA